MVTQRLSSGVIKKAGLIFILVIFAFLYFGLVGYAAPVEEAFYLQDGGSSDTLFCSSDPTEGESGGFCNVQIVLMIDDSGSMERNDPDRWRNLGALNLVDLFATKYYLPIADLQKENSEIKLPVVQVSVIHFNEELKNEDEIQWVTIAPESREQWDNQKKGEYNNFIELNDKPRGNTSFIEPFAKAQELFEDEQLEGDCNRRLIMLFTDGAPYYNGLIRGSELKKHMSAVKSSVDAIQNLPDGEQLGVYITAFNTANPKYFDYWKEEAKAAWWNSVTEIKLPELGVSRTIKDKQEYFDNINTILETETDPRHIQLMGEDPPLPTDPDIPTQVALRMEEITADLISLQREELVTGSLTIPSYVQSIRLTLFNIIPEATLEITDPDGNLLTNESLNVIVSGEDSAIETWDLDLPAAGEYQVKAIPSGTVTSLIAYQQVSVQFVDLPDKFIVSNPVDIKLKLSGPAEALDLTLFIDGNPTPLELTQEGDGYQANWTPTAAGEVTFTVDAKMMDGSKLVSLSCVPEVNRKIIEDEKIPPPTIGVDHPKVCIPPGESFEVPLKVTFEGEDWSWAESINWDIEAVSLSDPDHNVSATLVSVNASSGDFAVDIDPGDAEEIQLFVSAEAVIDGETVVIAQGIETTYPICDTPVCECEIWLIFIWLMMWVVIFLMGWVLIQGGKINLKFRLLVVLEIALAVIWYILFVNYRMYLLWMLILLAVLVFFLLIAYRRRIRNMLTWWLFILLTLFVSVWFVVFGGFSPWLIVLLLLFWLGILILLWLFFWQIDLGPSWMIWFVLLLLLVDVIVAFVYFSSFWILLLVWLLVMLVMVLVIRVAGPFCPPVVIAPPDDLTVIEGIGPKVQQLLYEHGVNTFDKLKNAEVDDLNEMLNSADYDYMDPKTWPYQAELAQNAKESGKEEDQKKFDDYKEFVKGGISPDEYNRPEDERSDEVKKPPNPQ